MSQQNMFLKKLLAFEKNKYNVAKNAIRLAHDIAKSEHKLDKPIVHIVSNLLSQEDEAK